MFIYKKTRPAMRAFVRKSDREKERLKRLKRALDKWSKPLSKALMELWHGQIQNITIEDVTKAYAAFRIGKFVYDREMAAQTQRAQEFANTVLREAMSVSAAEAQPEFARDFPKADTPVARQSFENWLQGIDLKDFDYKAPQKPASAAPEGGTGGDVLTLPFGSAEDILTLPPGAETLSLPETGTAGLNYEQILERYISEHTGEFVQYINAVQQRNIQDVIRGMDAGRYSPATARNMIANSIGLTERDYAACERYYNSARESIASAHPNMSAEEVNRAASERAGRYAEQKRRERAERIARTEIVAAHNNAYDLYIKEAQRQGLIGEVVLKWISAREGVCEHCARLDGQVIEIDGEFKTEISFYGGQKRLPPAHPNCRCVVLYIEKNSPQAKSDTSWYDSMSESEKKAFHNRTSDREQWKRYIKRLGKENVPETLEKFQEMKYNDNKVEYESLQGFYRYKNFNPQSSRNDYNCVAELRQIGVKGNIHIPQKEIDIVSLGFDDKHINQDRKHDVAEDEAKRYISTAVMSITKRSGLSENYYSFEGVSYINPKEHIIKTAFSEREFDDAVLTIMEVLKKYEY